MLRAHFANKNTRYGLPLPTEPKTCTQTVLKTIDELFVRDTGIARANKTHVFEYTYVTDRFSSITTSTFTFITRVSNEIATIQPFCVANVHERC